MPNIIKKIFKQLFLSSVFFVSLLIFGSTGIIYAADPSLVLSPSTSTYYVGQTFNVDVLLNSGENLHRSTFLQIDFDQTKLKVVDIINKNLYWSYYDQDLGNDLGMLKLKGDFYGNSYSTSGIFATVQLQALAGATSADLVIDSTSYMTDSLGSSLTGLSLTGSSFSFLPAENDAVINIISDYDSWAIGDTQPVFFELDSQGNDIAGVDLVIHYDQSRFEFQSMTWMNLFPNQQGFSVDQLNGIITISGVANQGSPVNAKGVIVKLFFKALEVGSSDFSLDWTLGSTTDSNIVDYHSINTDLLTSTPMAKVITVGAGASLDFSFNLLGFLGTGVPRSGSITVAGPNAVSDFSTIINLGAGGVTNHNLGTFAYGSAYDLILKVQGYLKEKQNSTISVGVNTLAFGNLRPGDVNNDGTINTFDLYEIYNYWNNTGYSTQDLNADGKVNSFDVGLLYNYFNEIDNI